MVLVASCAWLHRCCQPEQEDLTADPPAPARPAQDCRPAPAASQHEVDQHADKPGGSGVDFMDMLDAPLLSLILSQCDMRDILTARAVSTQWRSLAEEAALDSFKSTWGLHTIVGRPRSPALLMTLGKGAFVRQRKLHSHLDTLSSLAVACDTDVATLKICNNIFSEHSLHTRNVIFIPAEVVQGLDGEFHFCPFANRQLVVMHTDEAGTDVPLEELDPVAKQQAEEQTMAKLAQILSRSLRVDLQQATFYLHAAKGDVRAAMRLHERDVRWERSRRRHVG